MELIDGFGIDVSFMGQVIHQPEHHFKFNTHFEPFVIEIKSDPCFKIYIILVEFYDFLLTVLLLPLFCLRSKIKCILNASEKINTEIIITGRSEFKFKWEIDVGGRNFFS